MTLEDRVAQLEGRLGQLEANVEPWIGSDGQATWRLERLEQSLQTFLLKATNIEVARQDALNVLQLIRGRA